MGQGCFNHENAVFRKVTRGIFKAVNLVIGSHEIKYRVVDQIYKRLFTIGFRSGHITEDHIDIPSLWFGAKFFNHIRRQFYAVHLDTFCR